MLRLGITANRLNNAIEVINVKGLCLDQHFGCNVFRLPHLSDIIGERERAYLVVQLARFFYIIIIYIYIYIYISTGGCCTYRIFLNVST